MTAIERVRRTRLTLAAGAIVVALAWGFAAALAILAALAFADVISGASQRDAGWHSVAAIVGGLVVATVLIWRSRRLTSVGRVALWLEEKIPGLHYSLVTAIEYDGVAANRPAIEAAVARHDIGAVTRRAVGRIVLPAIGAALTGLALLYVSPSSALGGAIFRSVTGKLPGAAAAVGNRLEGITVQVIPPAYTGERSTSLDDPASVSALIGSRIVLRGEGRAEGIIARAGATELKVEDARGGWMSGFAVPTRPTALMLRDRSYERIIVLQPRADNPPRIVLTSPERDSTLRAPRLMIRLTATATDDIGLEGAYFEYLVTTGSGEIFSARTITTPVQQFGGARRGSISGALDLASLNLKQGDVVSIRAITQDRNSLSGPGLATSDTRTFRIARAGEYDSVALEAAGPLPVDSSAMSQRMLIMMTEQLVREQKSLTRQQLVKRSTEIGDLEDRVRKRVHEILYEQEAGAAEDEHGAVEQADPHDHSDEPVPAHNRDLLEAYNALWEAVRSLQIAEPQPALPPMRVALKALDRARLANRMYLRGIPPKVIVDLARVRMTGKEKGSGNIRTPVSAADSARARFERRFSDAVELIESDPQRAVRAFTLLQVDALSSNPGFAAAVGEAIEAFRKGRDATLPLIRARRTLSGAPSATPGLPSWSGGP